MNTNWQQMNIPKDAFLSLLNNKFISDVKFRFADKRTIFAHSFVLCCRSGEYYNSFVANIGVSKLIEVRDFTYEEFYEFLKHLYTNACQVNEATAGGVIKLSKQHSLPELTTQCAEVLFKEINVSNAFAILETSIESELIEVTKKATEFIAGNYFAALSHESFLKVNDRSLQLILEMKPVLGVGEFKIFEQVMKWAAQACLTEGIEASGSNKRTKLGNNWELIRFGLMSVSEFAKCEQLEPGLLEDKEVISIYRSIVTSQINPLGFLNNKCSQMDTTVLDSVEFHGWWQVINRGKSRRLSSRFSVSHCITLEQIKLIQMDNIVKLKLQLCSNGEDIYESSGPFTGFLNPKPKLQPNVLYYVCVEYSTYVNTTSFISTTKHKSKSKRCEFTLIGDTNNFWQNKCIQELIFHE